MDIGLMKYCLEVVLMVIKPEACRLVYSSILELLGNTSMIRLEKIMEYFNASSDLHAKPELF